jgi:hypothetical protein
VNERTFEAKPFADENTREWFAYSYRIISRVENEAVIVATIIHAKRLLNSSSD